MNLLDEAPVIVWLTDARSSCTFLSRRWYDLTGQAPETGLGAGWLNTLHPEDRERVFRGFQAASEKREAVRSEFRLRTKEGAYRWMIVSASPRFGLEDEFLGYIGTVIDIDDRKAVEESLRASEERYRNLFESIDEGFCVIEMIFDDEQRPLDYRWLEINPSFAEQTGLQHAVGKTVRELVPDLDESWFEIYGEVALTGRPTRFENQAPAMKRWFDVFAFRVDKPEQRRFALLFNDISERKERELNAAFLGEVAVDFAKVASSRELMAVVGEKLCRHLDVQSAAFVDISDDGKLATVVHERQDPSLPSLAGVHRLADFMSEDFVNELRAGGTVAISDISTDPRTIDVAPAYEAFGVRSHIQTSYLSEGRWRFMLSVHSPEPRVWRGGEVDLMRELTARVWLALERTRTEENLRVSERQARAFFEGSGVGAAQVGPDMHFRKVNDKLCEITGYSREELLTMTPLDLDHPDEREMDRERIRRVIAEIDSVYDVEKRYRRKDGQVIWVHVNSRPVRDAKGLPIYTASVIQDITDRRRAEESLRKSERNLRELSRSLERRVAERTRELEEQTVRLRHLAAELASAEQRERKRLAALLHDDLQQLLVAASMHLNKAGRTMKNEADQRSVEQAARWITEATKAARALTHQLRPPALYEDSLVSALHGLASEMAERHHLQVAIEGREATGCVSDDLKALLFESVRELLFNAAKYAEVEEARVRVWEEGNGLHVLVEDGGKGFDVAAAARNRAATGFGLFSIRERVAAVGGKLTITSAPGAGTRVALEVPFLPGGMEARPVLADDRAPRAAEDRRGRVADDSSRKISVLIVDDHAMVRQGLANLLDEDERLEVVAEAADGFEAIDAVGQHRPDVMLVDLNMPRMNGIEATREIHRRWPDTMVIGLSVQDDAATAKAIRDAGAAAFLSKAGDSDRLIETILELADGRGIQEGSGAGRPAK